MSNIVESNSAYIINLIGDVCGKAPGKKKLQKLVYLIEQKGVPLGYEHGLHFYGPYSSKLDEETMSLSMDGVISFDYSGCSHKMSVNTGYEIKSSLTKKDEAVAREVIDHFKNRTPLELELLSTALYAHDNLEDKSRGSIINGVKKIKGDKYNVQEIEQALNDFCFFNKKIS